MLDLGSCLNFAVLDLTFGLVEHTVVIQLGIGAAAHSDLQDCLMIFMRFVLLYTYISGVGILGVFFAMQQFGDLCDIGHISDGAMGRDEAASDSASVPISASIPKKYRLPFFV